jgi:putative tryptophan/tyrosine transport system substrate-binding protein
MRRRDLIKGIAGSAAAWPLAARAQQAERKRLVGGLMGLPENDPEGRALITTLEQSLADLGWSSGGNLRLIYRFAEGVLERIQKFANELVGLKPDVIFAANTPAVVALQEETRTIPIIFANLLDPVESGLVSNLAHPGGNVTGFAGFQYSMAGKWLEILREAIPNITRVAVLFNPDTAPYAPKYIEVLRVSGTTLGVPTKAAPVREVGDLEPTIAAEGRAPGGSIVVMPSNFTNVNRASIISLMARYRVPAIYPFRVMAKDGGLLFYGASVIDQYRRAASYVDRILRNENPGQLPVQLPTKFELIVNLKTANALGITIPSAILSRADDVIE